MQPASQSGNERGECGRKVVGPDPAPPDPGGVGRVILLPAHIRYAARDVPAYREFLTSQGIDSADVKTYADFQTLPLTTKQNYMLAISPASAYPRRPACRVRDGRRVLRLDR
jgi:hypothetical protein